MWGSTAYREPTSRAWMKPLHTAITSKAPAFTAPSLCWTMAAVLLMCTSGLLVARTIMSRSSGSTPASLSADAAALTARSLVQSSSSAILRSLMPVFVVIHSSLVSTI